MAGAEARGGEGVDDGHDPAAVARAWLRRRRRRAAVVAGVFVLGVVMILVQGAVADWERSRFFDDADRVTGMVVAVGEDAGWSTPVRVAYSVDGRALVASFDVDVDAAPVERERPIEVFVASTDAEAAHVLHEVDAFGAPRRIHGWWGFAVLLLVVGGAIVLVPVGSPLLEIQLRMARDRPWRPVRGRPLHEQWMVTDEVGQPTYGRWRGPFHPRWMNGAPDEFRVHVSGVPDIRPWARSLVLVERITPEGVPDRSWVAVAWGPRPWEEL